MARPTSGLLSWNQNIQTRNAVAANTIVDEHKYLSRLNKLMPVVPSKRASVFPMAFYGLWVAHNLNFTGRWTISFVPTIWWRLVPRMPTKNMSVMEFKGSVCTVVLFESFVQRDLSLIFSTISWVWGWCFQPFALLDLLEFPSSSQSWCSLQFSVPMICLHQ